MHRTCSAEGKQGDTAQVRSPLHSVHPGRRRHVLVDHLMDACRCLHRFKPELASNPSQCTLSEGGL